MFLFGTYQHNKANVKVLLDLLLNHDESSGIWRKGKSSGEILGRK